MPCKTQLLKKIVYYTLLCNSSSHFLDTCEPMLVLARFSTPGRLTVGDLICKNTFSLYPAPSSLFPYKSHCTPLKSHTAFTRLHTPAPYSEHTASPLISGNHASTQPAQSTCLQSHKEPLLHRMHMLIHCDLCSFKKTFRLELD